MRGKLASLVLALALLAPAAVAVADSGVAYTERVSLATGGGEPNAWSTEASISRNARFVAFYSEASNLVPGDTNGYADIFLRDRQTGKTERVSVATGGGEANDRSLAPSISGDGRLVAFHSSADNLVAGDTMGQEDVFVRDRQTGKTERVSVAMGGREADAASGQPTISPDGRFVAFISCAANLVSGDTNVDWDVFVRDRKVGTTERVSISSSGEQGNGSSFGEVSISADGRFAVFESWASNLVPGDTDGQHDIFVRDRKAGTTERVSVSSSGEQADSHSWNPSVSDDGRFVAFDSEATNLVGGDTNGQRDIFVRDRQTGKTERVNVSGSLEANDTSSVPSISGDGRFVAFQSGATNLAPGDINGLVDIYMRDRQVGTIERLSISSIGGQGYAASTQASISLGGEAVAFHSEADTLVADDTNDVADVFVHQRGTVDSTAPTTAAKLSGTQGLLVWYVSDVKLGLTAQDNPGGSGIDSIHFSLDGGTEIVYTLPVPSRGWTGPSSKSITASLPWTSGIHTVTYYAVDRAGNREVARSLEVKFDRLKPVFQAYFLDPPPTIWGWNKGDVTVKLTATDGAARMAAVDGPEVGDGSGVREIVWSLRGAQNGGETVLGDEATVPITAQGTTTLSYYAVDNAGNRGALEKATIRIDRTSPAVSITSPKAVAYNPSRMANPRIQASFSCSDRPSGVDSCTGSLDGAAVRNGSTIQVGELSLGTHSFEVKAVDKAGNETIGTVQFQIVNSNAQ